MSKPARLASWIALFAMMNPLAVWGAPPTTEAAVRVTDLALDSAGCLNGVVVTGAGHRQAKAPLRLKRIDRRAAVMELSTDRDGAFRSAKLSPGIYQIETSEGIVTCRVWSQRAAPPSAAKSLLVVNDAQVVRGQRPVRELFSSDPFLMTGIIAAAIAIPIAVHKSRDDAPAGS